MSTRKQVTFRDLVEEAKKRIVILVICVVGLSYLMSLTSSSVWMNLPAAASLIIVLRYLSLDFDMRRKAVAYNSKSSSENSLSKSKKKPPEIPKIVEKSEWRRKVNSPIVEDAIDHFTRHLISEWVTDLWYSRLTPDKEGPEELVKIMNGALGEISGRLRNINLIDLLTRDLINLICTHLEQFRLTQSKIERQQLGSLTIEDRDVELRRIRAAEDKLHPALFSAEAQHKVLQHLMDGLISFTFKHDDLQCLYFRYTARELLASAVMRPILNLASPRFINERIESLSINMRKANKGVSTVQEASQSKPDGSKRISSDHFSKFLDPSVTGVELVQLKNGQSKSTADTPVTDNMKINLSKDPLLSIDTRSSRTGGEWGEQLEVFSRRKTRALEPEHFENMWAKGRNYRKNEDQNQPNNRVDQGPSSAKSVAANQVKTISKTKENDTVIKLNPSQRSTKSIYKSFNPTDSEVSNECRVIYHQEDDDHNLMDCKDTDSGSNTSYTSEDEETNNVTGLNSPETKVWDRRSKRNLGFSHIHHPLENVGGRYKRIPGIHSRRKRSRPSSQKVPVWQEVQRTSFLSGDGQDILSSSKGLANDEDTSDDSEMSFGRVHSGAAASSSAPSFYALQTHTPGVSSLQNSLEVNSFFRLRCEVLGANIVKSGSRTFAVYSISVTDVNNNSWTIKRRFRHFEELHRRLKEFPDYNLHLPPKHFLSTGLDVFVIQERCKLLDEYIKKLMQLPTISGSIEVWDFLSVDSQTYIFTNSFSIVETLSVDLDNKPAESSKKVLNSVGPATNNLSSTREHISTENKESVMPTKNNFQADDLRLNTKGVIMQKPISSPRNLDKTIKGRERERSEVASDLHLDAATDPTLPTEWVPPNLSVPIFDLVDVIFQLQDGGWIRRKAFWVAKQVLQLGMGDAFDDWLLEKIQLLRKGSVIASVIRRVEQILWPDGIFISKHPKRRQASAMTSPSYGNENAQMLSPGTVYKQQQADADRRKKFVYELMIDNAPAAIVGLVGRKEYEQCAKDLYFFLQSNVCLKQLAFDLIELVLLSAFPELDYVFKQLHEEKHKFGEFKAD